MKTLQDITHQVRGSARVTKGSVIVGITLCMLSLSAVSSESRPLRCDEVKKGAFDNLLPGLTLSEDPNGLVSVKKGERFIASFDCDHDKKEPVVIAFFGSKEVGEIEKEHLELFAKFASLITHSDQSALLSKLIRIRDEEKKRSPGSAPLRSTSEINGAQLMCSGDSAGSMCATATNGVDLR